MDGGHEIRNAGLEGTREMVAWAGREGWEPGLTDADAFHAADPDGFFALTDAGRTVATLSAVRCSADVAFVGFYIVDPENRGTGLGLRFWNEVLSGIDAPTLGLDAVPEQVGIYETDGFAAAYGNARYSAEGLPDARPMADSLRPAAEVDFDLLVEFDAGHCFGPRPGFLKFWIDGDGRESMVATDQGGEIKGFAASRRTGLGHRIGPVFADDDATAKALILTVAGKAGERVAVDVPLANSEAVALLESFGMERSFETVRMYRGPEPELPLGRIFGLTSLELG